MSSLGRLWIKFVRCRGVTRSLLRKVLSTDPGLSLLQAGSVKAFATTFSLDPKQCEMIFSDFHQLSMTRLLAEYTQKQIFPITLFDPEYPDLLKEIYDPPAVLYCKGKLAILKNKKVLSVVGTRRPTAYGMRALEKIVPPLVEAGWTIVSGLAYGIDARAHELALNGMTIAVLGSGIENIYPAANRPLAEQIASQHLLVTEYVPQQKPAPWQFPARNRIISGLARATLVIEAREKSGTLITADQALEQGRDVYAVPGSIFAACSSGTNRLIQQGAKAVLSAEDIFCEWPNESVV